MKRLLTTSALLLLLVLAGCYSSKEMKMADNKLNENDNVSDLLKPDADGKIRLTDQQWKQILTDEQYHVTREGGTELPFTGEYYKTKDSGIYVCSNCGAELFNWKTKYDSGCGWPSFYAAEDGKIDELEDNSLGMKRIEIRCSRCGAHLGHVFTDGPNPTGLRYCVNSASLKFKKDSDNEAEDK